MENPDKMEPFLTKLTECLPDAVKEAFTNITQEEIETEQQEYAIYQEKIVSKHQSLYNQLLEKLGSDPSTKQIYDWEDESDKTKTIGAIKDNIGNLPQELSNIFEQYSDLSWNLVITNHRFIYSKIKHATELLENQLLSSQISDLFQESLIVAYNAALRYDSNQGHFVNFISDYIYLRSLYTLYKESGISENFLKSYIVPYKKASTLLEETYLSRSIEARELLATAIYYRLVKNRTKGEGYSKAVISFNDDEILTVIEALKTFLNGGNLNIEHSYDNLDRLRTIISNHIRSLRINLLLFDTLSLDREILRHDKDRNTTNDTSPYEKLTDSQADTIEEIVDDNLLNELINKTIEFLTNTIQDEKGIRNIQILLDSYGYPDSIPMSRQELAEKYKLDPQSIDQIIPKTERLLRNHPALYELKEFL
jgi:DNA-directed RNA polymerase sigma subunit (sigma70/sigma32)